MPLVFFFSFFFRFHFSFAYKYILTRLAHSLITMSTSVIVRALLECEFQENENLITVLSNVKSSKASPEDAHIASMVRGLCTHNSKLIGLLQTCLGEFEQDKSSQIESFKLLVNSFVIWADTAVSVFEKYLKCPGLKISLPIFSAPVLHCGCYLAFIDSSLATIRNPFVADKLQAYKHLFKALLESYTLRREEEKLNNISFEKVKDFGGRNNVSAHFSLSQIVERSKNESIQSDNHNVELLLLNLSKTPSTEPSFNAFAIVEISGVDEKRFVLYPPFRVNELIMSVSDSALVLTSSAPGNNDCIVLQSKSTLIQSWYTKLENLFSPNSKAVSSMGVMSYGLGIETGSDDCCEGTPSIKSMELNSNCSESTESRSSDNSRRDSMSIMIKTLSNHGLETSDQIFKETLVVQESDKASSRGEYDYAGGAESLVDKDDDDLTCFEIVNGPIANKAAAASLPNLAPPKNKVYTNAAGSAIDIYNFGKDYNPSFVSLVGEESSAASKGPKKERKKSFFSIFKKNKSKAENTSAGTPAPVTEDIKESSAPQKSSKPELSVEVPKNSDFVTSNQPLSSTSSTFGRSLPLPFALPNSESTYFFKKPAEANIMSHNNSTTSLLQSHNEEHLIIPDELKQIINSEETEDVFISPSSPGSLKVSKWRTKYGKWELLTRSEDLFIKIVANKELDQRWMLVFKEEFDEEYQEIADVPLLILSIDSNTNIRQSSALDLEVSSVNSITKEKMLIIARCYNTGLLGSLFTTLMDAKDAGVANMKKPITSHDSNNTLASSLMSGKPSASSTLNSIYTVFNDAKAASAMGGNSPDNFKADGERLLLDRMTIKLHKQMDSYERIHHISSWNSIAMYTMNVFHSSMAEVDGGKYHFELEPQANGDNTECPKYLWTFETSTIFDHIETIGKAGMLVKVNENEIFMVECKGKKQLNHLYKIF